MKHLLSLIFLLAFVVTTATAQISLRPFHLRPRGEFGFVMKPVTSLEIGFMHRFNEPGEGRLRTGFGFTLLNFKPRLTETPTVGVLQNGNGTTVIPGTQMFRKYLSMQFSGGSDFAFIHQEKWAAFVGSDVLIGGVSVSYFEEDPLISTIDYTGGGIMLGIRFRLGVEYNLSEKLGVFTSIQSQGCLVADPRTIWSTIDVGAGARYSF